MDDALEQEISARAGIEARLAAAKAYKFVLDKLVDRVKDEHSAVMVENAAKCAQAFVSHEIKMRAATHLTAIATGFFGPPADDDIVVRISSVAMFAALDKLCASVPGLRESECDFAAFPGLLSRFREMCKEEELCASDLTGGDILIPARLLAI